MKLNICTSILSPVLYSLFFMLAGCGRDDSDGSESESRQPQSGLFSTSGSNELRSALAFPAKIIRVDTQSLRGNFWVGTVRARVLPVTFEIIKPQISALLDTIAAAEGTSKTDWACGVQAGYTAIFSCKMPLPSFDRHPDIVLRTAGYASAAAGRYQFMPFTWNNRLPALGSSIKSVIESWNSGSAAQSQGAMDLSIAPFGPLAQDMGALLLIKYKVKNGALAWNKISSISTRLGGVLKDPDRDPDKDPDFVNFRSALAVLAPEWASLPNSQGFSDYRQPVKHAKDLWKVYTQALEIYSSADQQISQNRNEVDGAVIASGQ